MYPKVTMTKVLGKTPFLYQFCHTLGISEVVDAELTSDEQKKAECSIGEIVTALVVNRLTSPTPLYRVQEWARDSGFELLFPCAAEYLNDDRLGRTLDLLYPHLEAIQEAIVLKAVTQFNINPEFIHYDITSVYFQGEYDEVDWVTYGYSRDQKPDLVQCNLGLNVTDAETFPALWSVLPGDTNDTSTVITNMENLKKRFPKATLLHIGDRAMFSKDIYQKALQLGIDLIAPCNKLTEGKKLLDTVNKDVLPITITDEKKKTLSYRLGEYQLSIDTGAALPPLRAIVVWSAEQSKAAEASRLKKVSNREEELQELQKKLNTPRYKKKSAIEKKLQKIMGTDPVNDGFQVNLTGEDDHLVLEYQLFPEVFTQQKQHEGLYILLATVAKEKMSALEVFHAYKRQFGVEDSFRTLKNPLKIRPLFVHKTERLQALIFIIMLALVVYSILELLLVRNGLHYSLQRALQLLSSLVLVQLLLPDQELSFQIAPPECRDPLILNTFDWLTIHEWTLEKILHRYTGLKPPINLTK